MKEICVTIYYLKEPKINYPYNKPIFFVPKENLLIKPYVLLENEEKTSNFKYLKKNMLITRFF